jgi:hypothetical protein
MNKSDTLTATIEEAGSVSHSAEASLEQTFRALAEKWRKETSHFSLMLKKAMHPAYQRIIGLGPSAIPLILREMQQKPGHWFWALNAITGEDPAHPGDNIEEARQAWLQWGREKGYL